MGNDVYYLVIDHTLIGAANGNQDGNGNNVFNNNRFTYSISGVDFNQGHTQAYSGASPSHTASGLSLGLAALLAVITALVFRYH